VSLPGMIIGNTKKHKTQDVVLTWSRLLLRCEVTEISMERNMDVKDFFTTKRAIEDALYKFAELNIEKSKMAGAYITLDEFELCGTGEGEHVSASFRQCFQNNDYETHTFRLPLEFFDGVV